MYVCVVCGVKCPVVGFLHSFQEGEKCLRPNASSCEASATVHQHVCCYTSLCGRDEPY